MSAVNLHLMAAVPTSPDTHNLTLLISGALIALTVAGVRWAAKRTNIIVMISGTSVLLGFLIVLVLGHLINRGIL